MGKIQLCFKGNLALCVQDTTGEYVQKNFMERSNYFINRTCKAEFTHQSTIEAQITEPFKDMIHGPGWIWASSRFK